MAAGHDAPASEDDRRGQPERGEADGRSQAGHRSPAGVRVLRCDPTSAGPRGLGLFRGVVREPARHHPADREQVLEGHQGTVPHTEMRVPEAARPVAYRHLGDAVAGRPEQGRDEAMAPAETRQVAQAVAPERAQAAPAVADAVSSHDVANPVGDP